MTGLLPINLHAMRGAGPVLMPVLNAPLNALAAFDGGGAPLTGNYVKFAGGYVKFGAGYVRMPPSI